MYHRLPLDKGLIFRIEEEPHLDRDRTVYADPSFIYRRTYKIPYFSSCIGVQPKRPFDAIGRLGVGFCRLETPVGKPGVRHVRGEKARQCRVMQARQPMERFDCQSDGCASIP